MTTLDQPCKDFGDIVDEVQQCSDPGKGLQQLATSGIASLLSIRDLGYKLFDVSEKAKADAAKARDAFDDKNLVLQNLLYESGYYQKEIQEARDYKSAVKDDDMELMSPEEFLQLAETDVTAELDAATADYNHQLMLLRLEHELQSRKQARQQLSELRAGRDALQTNLGQKRKALTDLRKHASHINASTEHVRQLFSLPDAAASIQQETSQLLPLPLYTIYSQATAILETLSTAVRPEVVGSRDQAEAELAGNAKAPVQPARKRQKRDSTAGPESDPYQAFPLSVKLHLTNLNLDLTFSYLPALDIVTVVANHKAGNDLLASLFKEDTGEDTPSTASQSAGDGSFVYDTKAAARPYRSTLQNPVNSCAEHVPACVELASAVQGWVQWLASLLPALPVGPLRDTIIQDTIIKTLSPISLKCRWVQWVAGLDLLPALPVGTLLQGPVSQEALQQAVTSHSRERRAIHILTTLVKRAEQASDLGQQLQELSLKRIPLSFPNRLFQQAPEASLHGWQELPKQAWPSSVAPAANKKTAASPQPGTAAEDDEEGELADAETSNADEEDGAAMDVDRDTAQGGETTSQEAPDPLSSSNQQGHIMWGTAGPDDPFRVFKFFLKSANNWQLDGHVQVWGSYPAIAPQIVVTAIKEAFNPTRSTKAARQELSQIELLTVQKQANKGLLAEVTEEEQSHVLSYQLVQLLASLTQYTQGKDAPAAAAIFSTPRARLELTGPVDAASANKRK